MLGAPGAGKGTIPQFRNLPAEWELPQDDHHSHTHQEGPAALRVDPLHGAFPLMLASEAWRRAP